MKTTGINNYANYPDNRRIDANKLNLRRRMDFATAQNSLLKPAYNHFRNSVS